MLVVQIYGRVCRVCLEKTSKLINLHETVGEYSLTMLELLRQSVPSLEAEMDFPLPHEICETCRNHLLIAYKLQRMCMATNQKLYRIWQESKNMESTIHTEDGEIKKENEMEIKDDCNEMDPIDLEFIADEKQLKEPIDLEYSADERQLKEPLPQLSDKLLEKQHGSGIKDFVHYHKEDMGGNELDKDDDDDDDNKPLICLLRNKYCIEKHAIKVKDIFTQEPVGQEKINFRNMLMSSGYHCLNCNISFPTSNHLTRHQCKEIAKGMYTCSKCSKRFSSTSLMQKHMQNKHNQTVLTGFSIMKSSNDMQFPEESSQCDQSQQGSIEDGVEDSYDNDKDSECSVLDNFGSGEEDFNRNLKSDPSIETFKKYNCIECNASFRFQKQLERHRKKHTDAHRFVCLVCSDRFKYPFMLQKHVEKHHPALSDLPKVDEIKRVSQEKSHACNHCSAAYTNVGGLAQHMSKKHPEIVPFKCDKCEKTFVVEEHLKIHNNRHMGIKNFKCDLCDKSFSFKFAMKQHMRIHTGDLNYLCTLCGKKFYRPSNLRQHMQRHSDDKPYTCPHCPKRFKCPSDRYIHLMSHQEGKNHVCTTCGSRFSRIDTLHQHQILHTGEKPYKCDQCPMAFPRLMNLNRHLRTHTGEKPYKCKYCDKAYAQSNDLNKHLRTHVGENTYMCTQCPSAFKYKAELKSHEWEHYRKQKQDEKQAHCERNDK